FSLKGKSSIMYIFQDIITIHTIPNLLYYIVKRRRKRLTLLASRLLMSPAQLSLL
uniref:Uncharacterized protein n=1 Tax=Amphimedon queenslandica TaxID=400682 RepID=A0A1X7UN30_AMPQE